MNLKLENDQTKEMNLKLKNDQAKEQYRLQSEGKGTHLAPSQPDNPAPDQNDIGPQENIDNFGSIGNAFQFNSSIQYLNIIGHIEGHNLLPSQNKSTKYEHIIPQLVAVEENPSIKGLLVILNTVGGDVEAGLAISELIASISKPTVSLVLGGGHSIGIPLATSTGYSFIAETATMTLHPIRMTGLVIGAEQTFNYFRKMQERIIDFIIRTSKADRKTVVKLMNKSDDIAADIGTILVGKEAVDIGLINQVGGLEQALKKLRSMIADAEPSENTPKSKRTQSRKKSSASEAKSI